MKSLHLSLLFLFSICILSSCIVPESTHKESIFHLLTKTSYDQNRTFNEIANRGDTGVEGNVLTFYLRQIELPYYLQENRIINRPDNAKIEFRENHRWGEPLEEGIGRVIGLNLSQLLQCPFYSVYPHRQKVGTNFEIGITINRFERVSSNKVLFDGRWQLFTNDFKNGSFPISNGMEIILVDIDTSNSRSDSINEEVMALSESLSMVAERVAVAVNSSVQTR
jgi:uncharacterized lipoprotein YmbA